MEDEAASPAYAEGNFNKLINQRLLREFEMTSVSFNRPNPTVSLNSSANDEKKQKEFKDAKVNFLEEIHNLYPEGKMSLTKDGTVYFKKDTLQRIANGEQMNDANSNPHIPSLELQNAARVLLENNAPSSINPKGDPWFTKQDLEHSIATDPAARQPIQLSQFGDIEN